MNIISPTRNISLFESDRMTLAESLGLTEQALVSHGERYRHWAIAYSGGKDSSALVTLVVYLLECGRVPKPETLMVLYADTRLELPPLRESALGVLVELQHRGIQTQVVLPDVDDRFFVYMFGRGVPPPKNRFRWCTPQLKVEPMMKALRALHGEVGEKVLMLTGVRIGESAARDRRITVSCSKDGAECGQGWFQVSAPGQIADTLAPIAHWRVCLVWTWLRTHAPGIGFATQLLAEVYGGNEAEEINCRTGCVGCNLVDRDTALDGLLRSSEWDYLSPLKQLRSLYRELISRREYRLRKNGERNSDGRLSANPMRLGPLTFEARRYGLSRVLGIQREINRVAQVQGQPPVSLINEEELERIEELISHGSWPQGWDGTEIRGDALVDQILGEGVTQPLLLREA